MALQGTLESFGISEIFQLVSQQGKTGTLEIDTDEGQARIRFLSGKIVEAWADKRVPSDFIGTMLVRAALITPVQLEHALDVQRQSLRPLGDILIRMGALRVSEFKHMLQLQHRETVYKLLGRKRGQFSFRDEPVEMEEGVSVLMDTGALLMEGFRQIDEWPQLRSAVPSDTKVMVPLRDPEGAISPDETRVLALVDGVSTVREVADRSRLGEFAAWKALASLAGAGIIVPLDATKRQWTPSKRKVASAFRAGDALCAALLVLLAVAVVLGGGAGQRVSRLAGGVAQARAEASEVTGRYDLWAERRPAQAPSGADRR